jgi:hypothetical protein
VQEQGEDENRLPGIVQVFGHTRMGMPFNYENRIYCLDCKRAFFLHNPDGRIYDFADGTPVPEYGMLEEY